MVKLRSRALSPRHDFFKVYLADFSSRQLSLPPAFAARLNGKGNVPDKVTLKDHTGKVWDVGLEKNHQDLVITEGWQHFVARHSLVDGDFLIFKFDGSSNFDIELYGRDGLKKRKGVDDDDIPIRNVKVENEEFVDTQQDTRPTNQGSDVTCRGRQPKSVETTPKDLGEGKVAQARLCGGPESLQFVMNVTTAQCVYVPRTMLRAHNIKLKKDLILHDDDGKKWPVRATWRSDRRILICRGWGDFLRGRGVKIGDKCVFSFVLNEGKECNVLHVKVVYNLVRNRGRPASSKKKVIR